MHSILMRVSWDIEEAKSVELIDEMIREFRFCVNLSGIFEGLCPV